MNSDPIKILERAGIKPTSNRVLVLKALLSSDFPLGLIELETELETLERSSISRVLSLFLEHNILHVVEDGRGIAKYEICNGDDHCSINDMHAHFYCERCNKLFCFEDVRAPHINIPKNFCVRSVNYMLKGLCPDCYTKRNRD